MLFLSPKSCRLHELPALDPPGVTPQSSQSRLSCQRQSKIPTMQGPNGYSIWSFQVVGYFFFFFYSLHNLVLEVPDESFISFTVMVMGLYVFLSVTSFLGGEASLTNSITTKNTQDFRPPNMSSPSWYVRKEPENPHAIYSCVTPHRNMLSASDGCICQCKLQASGTIHN